MNTHIAEVSRLKNVVLKLEGTIADMLKTQHPILRDAVRYQVLREGHREAAVVILSSTGIRIAAPHEIDVAVDHLVDQINKG